jgi:ribosome biogenesis GTPase
MSSTERFEAEVIAAYGRHLLVRAAGGTPLQARPFGRQMGVVCGDRVRCERDMHGEVIAMELMPRQHLLQRSNLRGGSEPIVANLDQLVVVMAGVPRPDLFMVDRYLAAAASLSLQALVVVNKADLPLDEADEAGLAELVALGYRVHRVAARAGTGLDALAAALAGHTSVLLGQSGVGKSSLIRRLTLDGTDAATGDLMRESEGRHTTTASRSYDCIAGGHIIDSPGVRDYAPAIDQLEPRSLGFIEVDRHGAGCQFMDCRHMNEPRCAVQAAVEQGQISARRYESYRRLRRLAEQLLNARAPHGGGRGGQKRF